MQARDFFDQIDLALYIQAPAGNADGKIRVTAPFRHQLETQLLQNAKNLVGLQLLAENAMNFGKMQSHGSQVYLPHHCVDCTATKFASRRFEDQQRHSIASPGRGLKVGAALEAM